MASFNEFKNQGLKVHYEAILDSLPEGLSIILIHPALESEEMQQISVDHPNFGAKWRAEDALYFTSKACSDKLTENNIELVTFKSPEVLKILGA